MDLKKVFTPNQTGFSLIELMVMVAVIGIVAAFAFPMYQDYVAQAREGVLRDNIQTIRLMQTERRRDRGEFAEGDYVPGGSQTLTARIGWEPRSGSNEITYNVECDTDATDGECTRTSGYTVTATHAEFPDDPVVMSFTD